MSIDHVQHRALHHDHHDSTWTSPGLKLFIGIVVALHIAAVGYVVFLLKETGGEWGERVGRGGVFTMRRSTVTDAGRVTFSLSCGLSRLMTSGIARKSEKRD